MELNYKDIEFTYEVDWKDVNQALEHILYDIAKCKKGESKPVERLINLMIETLDIQELPELMEYFKEELHEYFEEEANEQYQNDKDCEGDPYSQKDFI